MRTGLVLFLLLSVVAACSSSKAAAGGACTGDADCSGLACLTLAVFDADGGCASGPKACTKTCANDGECASLGAKYKCFAGCPGQPMTCGATP